MKKVYFILLLITFPVIFAEWALDWSDEFDGTTLDRSKWDIEVNCWGGGNLEKQCYTSRTDNIYLRDGFLHLRPIAGTYQGSLDGCTLNNENSCTWTQPATSGRVRTLRSSDGHWTYGKFEMRAKLPKGDFLWPAFWMLPTDNVYGVWASSGEIDIMEFRGQDKDSISHAIHFGGLWPNNRYYGSGNLKFGFDFTEDFHTFALEWSQDALVFLVDGKETHRESLRRSFGSMYTQNGQPFDKRFHILLNVAIGGNFFDPAIYGNFDIGRARTWTQPYIIDYVRVYKWVEGTPTAPPVTTPVSPPTATPITPPVSPPTSDEDLITIPIIPTADGYIDYVQSSQTFGKDSVLLLKKSDDDERSAYLKFFVPSIETASASLLLHGSIDSAKPDRVGVSVYAISNEWNETELCYEKKLERGDKIASGEISHTHEWYSFDISEYVKSQIKSDKNIISVEVALDEEANALFTSAQADSNQPLLRICI